MDDTEYLTGSVIKERFKVSLSTLQRLANSNQIRCIRTPGGKRYYLTEDINRIFNTTETVEEIEINQRRNICYARVSSNQQKDDLKRQIQDLKEKYPGYDIISDIGSGLNWKRKGFKKILDQAFEGNIKEIVILHRDRLCRFGFELLEFIFEKTGVKIVVSCEDAYNEGDELSEDLLAIVNFFVAKNNGRRASEKRRERIRIANQGEETIKDTG